MTFAGYFRALSLFHLAITIGQTAFLGMALLATGGIHKGYSRYPALEAMGARTPGTPPYSTISEMPFYAALVMAFAALIAAHYLFRGRVAAARDKQTLTETFTFYRRGAIERDAIANAVGLLAMLAYLLTWNVRFISITGLVILVFLVWWPTREKCLLLLGLDEDPRVADPDAVIGKVKWPEGHDPKPAQP